MVSGSQDRSLCKRRTQNNAQRASVQLALAWKSVAHVPEEARKLIERNERSKPREGERKQRASHGEAAHETCDSINEVATGVALVVRELSLLSLFPFSAEYNKQVISTARVQCQSRSLFNMAAAVSSPSRSNAWRIVGRRTTEPSGRYVASVAGGTQPSSWGSIGGRCSVAGFARLSVCKRLRSPTDELPQGSFACDLCIEAASRRRWEANVATGALDDPRECDRVVDNAPIGLMYCGTRAAPGAGDAPARGEESPVGDRGENAADDVMTQGRQGWPLGLRLRAGDSASPPRCAADDVVLGSVERSRGVRGVGEAIAAAEKAASGSDASINVLRCCR